MDFPQYQPDKAQYSPLTDDELSDLDDFLSELDNDAAMNIEAIDGYLSAQLLSPVPLSDKPGADWMSPVWGGGDPFASGKQRKKIALLLLRHVHSLSVQWTSKQDEWEPIFSVAEDGEQQLVDAEDWCTGSSLGYVNGTTLVLMNLNHEPLEMPAGNVLIRSLPAGAGHALASGETAWIQLGPDAAAAF